MRNDCAFIKNKILSVVRLSVQQEKNRKKFWWYIKGIKQDGEMQFRMYKFITLYPINMYNYYVNKKVKKWKEKNRQS